MFEKLLSNLPSNPSLVKEMGFYAKRMRQEQSLRRLGLVFVVLAFFVQFFAVISPPKPSLAASTNDMINGGFSSIAELTADCKTNIRFYATVLNYYGLSCANVADGQTVSLVSTSYNKQLFSMGWNPQGPVNQATGKPTDEQPVEIPNVYNQPNGGTLYWRYLWSWDTYSYSTYEAVKVTSSLTGKTYFILYTCGNLVSIGLPTPYTPPTPVTTTAPTPTVKPAPAPKPRPSPQPCPYNNSLNLTSPACKPCADSLSSTDTVACIQYSKTASDITQNLANANGQTAHAGDTIVYNLTAYNSGQATVNNFVMQDDLSYVMDYANVVSDGGGQINQNDVISWPAVNIAPTASETHKIIVQVRNPIPNTPPSSSDPELFDHIMTNIYGNTVNINLPQSPVSAVITTTQALPNTGPDDSLIIAAVIVMIVGYFLARARLLSLESSLAIEDNNGGVI
ncbi:hypothetical protein M1512_00910 [Patescibacteria group bacterium]|nr:hypothetical protein [Patescibacteria group bacterium]